MSQEHFSSEEGFEQKKREYFAKIGLKVRDAFELHKDMGLWDKNEKGERDWGNVSEHCLVEAARVKVLGEMMSLKEDGVNTLMTAAALHDFFKKGQKEIVTAKGLNRAAFAESTEQADHVMGEAGIDERIIKLVDAVSDESLLETEKILNKSELSDDDVSFLIMHYVDDYTIGSSWANATEIKDGKVVNDLDKRMDGNEANPRYQKLNEEGREVFNGETAYQAQRRIGHLVENRLADLVKEKGGLAIDPLTLPEVVDQKIKEEIESV